jgi:hypothetical protein
VKVTIESTSKIVKINGADARLWEGKTESGIPVHFFVTRIAVPVEGYDHSQFEAELKECKQPEEDLVIPARMICDLISDAADSDPGEM